MARQRRDDFNQWRCQWSVLILTAIGIVIYNTVANVWFLSSPSCRPQTTIVSYPTYGSPATCEPCPETAPSTMEDDPIALLDLRLGRWDNSRTYKLFDNVITGDLYPELSVSHRVGLATQSSIERLNELLNIAAHWSGPMSVAIFVTGDEMKLLRAFVTWLLRCKPDVYARMTLHIAMPANRPGVIDNVPKWARDCGKRPLLPGGRKRETVSWRMKNPYPQNHLRNLARKNCHTSYVFLVDIDIIPSTGMAESLDDFFATAPKCSLCAYVVPTYELDTRVGRFPEDKKHLLRLAKKKLAVPFHRKVFIYNQYASNFSKWESTNDTQSSETHVSHDVTNFELFYEPFYIAADAVPPHDERFLGYGFTRNTQVSMVLNGNSFCGGFIISPNHVVTAAHCVRGVQPSRIRLRVGSTRRDSGGTIAPVANVTVHPRYGQPRFDNDIAVLTLASPLTFGRNVRSVRLPRPRQGVPLVRMTVTGWGLTAVGNRRIPRLLMTAEVPVVPHWLCRLSYGRALSNNMFCGGHFLIGGVSSCQVYEMFLMGYKFRVLSPIFTIHWGLQTRDMRPVWRERQNDKNRKHFETLKRELYARYRKDPLHLLRRISPQQGKKGA